MKREPNHVEDGPVELGIASAVTLGNFGLLPEKEVTQHLGISDD